MKFWSSRSLITRTTMSFALITCAVIAALGMYFYHSARVSLEHRADVALMSRVEHFSRLVRQMYTVNELKERPLLFESMLGAEQDVLIFRRRGEAPFIDVNPERVGNLFCYFANADTGSAADVDRQAIELFGRGGEKVCPRDIFDK